jgi:hypothetical protein
MMGRTRRSSAAGLAIALTLMAPGLVREAQATSAWIPDEGDLQASASFAYETFDEYYGGSTLNDFPPGHLNQYSTRIFFDYGLWRDLAFDASLGFTATQSGTIPGDSGLDDTFLGLRWRAVDEFEMEQRWVPTVALRVGGIIAGTYDPDTFPAAAGVGGSGFETNVALGKLMGWGFALSSDFGYRIRSNNVPDDWQVHVMASKTFFERVSVQAGFRHKHSIGGIDLGEPGFTPQRSPELREIYSDLEVGLSTLDSRGLEYGLFYAYTLDGRNTGKKNIIGASISIPFRFAR